MIPQKDLLLLSHLRQDGRMTLTDLSKKTSVPVSTIFDKLNTHKKSKLIRHVTLLNFDKLGYHARATVMLKVGKDDKISIENYLRSSFHINSLYKINNGYDYFAECIFRDMKDLERFMEQLEQQYAIIAKNVYYIIDDIKKEAFMSTPETADVVVAN